MDLDTFEPRHEDDANEGSLQIVTKEQISQLVDRVALNTVWSKVSQQDAQYTIDLSASEFGQRMAYFFQAGMPDVRNLVQGPLIFTVEDCDISSFLGDGFDYWRGIRASNGIKGMRDETDEAAKMVYCDARKIISKSYYQDDDDNVDGETLIKRAELSENILLGIRHCYSLWREYKGNTTMSILEYLYKEKGIDFVYFSGTILRNPYGKRAIACLYRDCTAWNVDTRELVFQWHSNRPFAILKS